MYTVERTEEFKTWLDGLVDDRAFAKITARLLRLAAGNPGDVKPVGDGISEMRIDYGPGYRIYYKRSGKTVLLILCGGGKATQEKDISRAKELAAQL